MSQSPVNDFSERATLRYKQGWRALNRLLHEDRSFSGREADCAFLNCGGDSPSFATVSSVTGFDFSDDGRGLATADWDFDGDLDVWLTCRTAPRVRLVKNNTAGKPFVAFKLRGDGMTSNRDAIGARLELHLRGARKHPVRIRTLRGGEGFLSQSSNWIHFGLGDASGIEKLVIRWPGGEPQEITGIEPGRFYRISQGKEVPEIFRPPESRFPLTPSAPSLAAMEESARIIVAPGLPLPQLTTIGPDGSSQPWDPKPGRPTAINIWASWCAPCLAELTEWSAHRDELTTAGLDVVAYNTDSLGDHAAVSSADAAALSKKFQFSYANAQLSDQGLRALDDLQRAVLDRWKPLPLPATFLVDGKGELVAIYKGRVSFAQLLTDIKLATADADERRIAAVPFAGLWAGDAVRADPQRVANLMLDHDELDAAIEYLARCVSTLMPQRDLPGYKTELGDIYYMAGLLQPASSKYRHHAIASLTAARDLIPTDLRIRKALAQQFFRAGRGNEAAEEMVAATRINATDLSLKADLADLYERLGQFANAKPLLQELLAADPKHGPTHYRLAGVIAKLGDPRAAIQHYRQTLTDSPRMFAAANDLARLLASHPDKAVRSPDEAVTLAERLCAISKEKEPEFLDTLSIALANKGDFEQAIRAANKAVALLPAENTAAINSVSERIKLYQNREPFRVGAPQVSP